MVPAETGRDNMNSVKPTETMNFSERVGSFTIGTANVPAKGQYLTLVLRDGVPFDLNVAESVEDAIAAHEKFMLVAAMYSAMMGEQPEAGPGEMVVKGGGLLN
jgi:uncharacterized protein with von Willebrand factor type A (vWA) domain